VPPTNLRALRELVRHRHSVGRSLARERRCLRWLALKNNLPGPTTFTSDRAQKWILSQETKFSPAHRLAAHQRLDQIIALERHVADTDRTIAQHLASEPTLRHQVELLATIPGIGTLTAATILAETGDITRFDNPDQLGAYAGLAPRVSQSGETVHHGRISKHGPPILRWVLQQAAWVAIRTDPHARHLYTRIGKRAGAKKAATALARKLLIYAWSVARRQQPFHWPSDPLPLNPELAVDSYDI
jgi:transposase